MTTLKSRATPNEILKSKEVMANKIVPAAKNEVGHRFRGGIRRQQKGLWPWIEGKEDE